MKSLEEFIEQIASASKNESVQITVKPEETKIRWMDMGGMIRTTSGPSVSTAIAATLDEQGQR